MIENRTKSHYTILEHCEQWKEFAVFPREEKKKINEKFKESEWTQSSK